MLWYTQGAITSDWNDGGVFMDLLSTSYVPGISTLIAKVSPENKTENLPGFMEFTS